MAGQKWDTWTIYCKEKVKGLMKKIVEVSDESTGLKILIGGDYNARTVVKGSFIDRIENRPRESKDKTVFLRVNYWKQFGKCHLALRVLVVKNITTAGVTAVI